MVCRGWSGCGKGFLFFDNSHCILDAKLTNIIMARVDEVGSLEVVGDDNFLISCREFIYVLREQIVITADIGKWLAVRDHSN